MDGSSDTVKVSATIRNSAGIHCRPTAVIVKEARRFEDEIVVTTESGGMADPRSAIELLSLGLEKGSQIEIEATGSTASDCAQRMCELFETEFDFPPREKNDANPCPDLMA